MNHFEKLVHEMEALRSYDNLMDDLKRPSKGELFILGYLLNKNAPAPPSELSEALKSSNARISNALSTLEKKGQIHREIDTSNRRFILVSLTEVGRERIETMLHQMRAHMLEVLTEMGKDDAEEFVRLLKKFFEIMKRNMPGKSENKNCPCDSRE